LKEFNNQKIPPLLGAILDFRFWIADLLYRFALSFFIKLIRRRRTLNPNSKIQNPKFMRNKSGITFKSNDAKERMIFNSPGSTGV
jgi:curved DNA-binding protein CbpA